jgi:hypothetical protein
MTWCSADTTIIAKTFERFIFWLPPLLPLANQMHLFYPINQSNTYALSLCEVVVMKVFIIHCHFYIVQFDYNMAPWLESLEIAHRRFWTFNSKYIETGFEITFRKYVKFCRLFFVSENFCRLFSKQSLVMFWSGHSHRPNNSDVTKSPSRWDICGIS